LDLLQRFLKSKDFFVDPNLLADVRYHLGELYVIAFKEALVKLNLVVDELYLLMVLPYTIKRFDKLFSPL